MVAVDKDLLWSVVGTHFNYYESSQWNKEMSWHETTAENKMKWPYMQALIGDAVDGIKGVKGVGKAKAPKLLAHCETEADCWEVVKAEYVRTGETEIDALIAMRLVDMHQFNGMEVVLWTPAR
jgi:5'-3' exonuclease